MGFLSPALCRRAGSVGKRSLVLSSCLTAGCACYLCSLKLGWGGALRQGLSFLCSSSLIHMYYRYQPECGERVKKQDEVASHLHWKYKLNVHFPTLLPSITQVSCML